MHQSTAIKTSEISLALTILSWPLLQALGWPLAELFVECWHGYQYYCVQESELDIWYSQHTVL